MDSWKDDIRRWMKTQSRYRLGLAAFVVIALPVFMLLRPQGSDFRKSATQEIEIAKQICISAFDLIMEDPERLKMSKNVLDYVPVNGAIPKLKYVQYPKVVFMHNGFARINTEQSLYCVFNDPRGTNEFGTETYFYDYMDGTWRGTAIPHRKKEGFVR